MLGFSKAFVIYLFISIAVGYGSGNYNNTLILLGVFVIIRIIWKMLT